jgi:hypothetical protein
LSGAGARAAPDNGRYSLSVAHPDPGEHSFRLTLEQNGTLAFSDPVELSIAVEDLFTIEDAYPNPAAVRTQFKLAVKDAQRVTVHLYDVVGRKLRVVLDQKLAANSVTMVSMQTGDLPDGIYYYRVKGENFNASRSIVLSR